MNSEQQTLDPSIKDSIQAGAIGGSAFVARVLAGDSMPLIITIRKATSAVLTAWIANYYLIERIDSNGMRAGVCGLIGFCSPEIQEWLIKIVKQRLKQYSNNPTEILNETTTKKTKRKRK